MSWEILTIAMVAIAAILFPFMVFVAGKEEGKDERKK